MRRRGRQAARDGVKRVMVWRDFVLPGSETFIRNQMDAMTRWLPVLVGIRDVDSPIRAASDRILFDESLQGRVERKIFTTFGWSPRLARMLRRDDVALIHAHFGMGAVSVAPTARRLGLPLVVTVHGNDVTRSDLRSTAADRAGRTYARRLARALRYATTVIAVSEFIAQQVISGYGVPAGKVKVMRIGMPATDAPAQAPSESDLLFVGRLVAKKGVSDLLNAAARVGGRIDPPRVVIIGDGKLREDLEAEARALGVDAVFLGAQSPVAVARAMERTKIFVGPSRTAPDGDAEGFGMVFLEAAQAARPVVAYDHGGVAEAVVDGVTGILVPEGDVGRLAEALMKLLGDAGARHAMGEAGRRRVVDEFDIRRCTAALEDEYDRVTGGGERA